MLSFFRPVRLPTWVMPAIVVFASALGLRLGFALLTSGTFDPDEFVVVALGHKVAGGALPYRDFTYFHPPGLIFLFAALNRFMTWWWPFGRILTLTVDSCTAVLVWAIGRRIFSEREGIIAGLLYALSPITLVSAVRIGPDPIIAALGALGLLLLLTTRSKRGALCAGAVLAVAVWTKYPAALYLPLYVLLAPRRLWAILAGWGLVMVGLFAPWIVQGHEMFRQTVMWQLGHRDHADLAHRLASVGTYLVALNAPAVIALWRKWKPFWLPAGFCLGGVFLFTAQAYYHYFVLVAPLAALLAAPVVRRIVERAPLAVTASAVAVAGFWGLSIAFGPPPMRLFVTAARFSDLNHTATVIERVTSRQSSILTDEFEYGLFSHRRLATNYFWDMNRTVRARELENRLPEIAAVVTTKNARAYPSGFAEYLAQADYPHIDTGDAIIWLTHGQELAGTQFGRVPQLALSERLSLENNELKKVGMQRQAFIRRG